MKDKTKNTSVLLGAALLMATSAIGPGFLTQTAQFASEYLEDLAPVITCVIIMDIIVQVNIWSVIGASGLRGPEIADRILPGLGIILTALVTLGGVAFNIGNVGGAALGLNAAFGIPEKAGIIAGGILAIFIFLSKSAKTLVDILVKILAGIIIAAMAVICITSRPPLAETVMHILEPDEPVKLLMPTLTLLGGSCGGYVSFSGAHRLLDAGYNGKNDVKHFRSSVLTGICMSGTMRILLFLCVLGVCIKGGSAVAANIEAIQMADNPAAEAFRLVAGDIGYRLFGIILFSAALSSVIGAAYTSVSFLKTVHPFIARNEKWFTVGIIAFSTLIMAILGGAKRVVILAGAVNGLILPIALSCILLACRRKDVVGEEYHHPVALRVLGWIVVLIVAYLAITALPNLKDLFE